MKELAIVAALMAFSGAAFADTTVQPNPNAKSQGSCVGVYSSRVTGNGANIGGGTNGSGQTTYPGSRAEQVHQAQAADCNTKTPD